MQDSTNLNNASHVQVDTDEMKDWAGREGIKRLPYLVSSLRNVSDVVIRVVSKPAQLQPATSDTVQTWQLIRVVETLNPEPRSRSRACIDLSAPLAQSSAHLA